MARLVSSTHRRGFCLSCASTPSARRGDISPRLGQIADAPSGTRASARRTARGGLLRLGGKELARSHLLNLLRASTSRSRRSTSLAEREGEAARTRTTALQRENHSHPHE